MLSVGASAWVTRQDGICVKIDVSSMYDIPIQRLLPLGYPLVGSCASLFSIMKVIVLQFIVLTAEKS